MTVFYRKARIERSTELIKGIVEKVFTVKEPVSDILYKKVLEGFTVSDQTPPKILNYLKNNNLI